MSFRDTHASLLGDLGRPGGNRALASSPWRPELVSGAARTATPSLVVQSPAMLELLGWLAMLAPSSKTVILVGESGTGKSFLGRLLHQLSRRRGPLVEVGAGELADELGRDVLAGHERGGYTGAVSRRRGLLAGADDGTVLVHDAHELLPPVQLFLYQVLDWYRWRPHGMDRPMELGARFVIGTCEEPDAMVAAGRLRPELRNRFGKAIRRVPPLRERREEVAAYAQRFLADAPTALEYAGGPTRLAPEAVWSLELMDYPGNLRDVREAVQLGYLAAFGRDEIGFGDLPEWARVAPVYDRRAPLEVKLRLVAWALRMERGCVARAARRLGAHRNTVGALRGELERRGHHRRRVARLPRAPTPDATQCAGHGRAY